jgi:hypothetical protein
MYTMYNDQIRVIHLCVTSNIYHVFVLGTFDFFFFNCFDIGNKVLLTVATPVLQNARTLSFYMFK